MKVEAEQQQKKRGKRKKETSLQITLRRKNI